MSFATLKAELARLPKARRRELVGYLLSLNRSAADEKALRVELARKIDDKNPANWVTIEEAEKMLLK